MGILLSSNKSKYKKLNALSDESGKFCWNGYQWSQPHVSVKSFTGDGVRVEFTNGFVLVCDNNQTFKTKFGYSIPANSLQPKEKLLGFFLPNGNKLQNLEVLRKDLIKIKDATLYNFNEPFIGSVVLENEDGLYIQIGG